MEKIKKALIIVSMAVIIAITVSVVYYFVFFKPGIEISRIELNKQYVNASPTEVMSTIETTLPSEITLSTETILHPETTTLPPETISPPETKLTQETIKHEPSKTKESITEATTSQTSSSVQPLIDYSTDSLGNINTNSWAKGSGGDWSSGGLDAAPTIYIGDIITFTINVSNTTNLQYKFDYQPPGGSFITIQNWSSANICSWTVPANAFGKWTIVNAQVRNNDGLNFLGFCDDYNYLIYIVLSR